MNKIFLSLFKGGKNAAKYVIFSAIFVFATFFGFVNGNEVEADSMFKPVGSSFANNDQKVGSNTGDLTTIGGKLFQGCTYSASTEEVANNYFGYTINTSSYKQSGSSDCITYNTKNATSGNYEESGKLFYLQATDETGTANTITFTITIDQDYYSYITIWERGFTTSSGTTEDYDLYWHNGTSYVYERQYGGATPASDPAHSLTATGRVLQFTYQLRNSDYNTQHLLSVYFYNADPHTNSVTKRAELKYTLAKPISDFGKSVNTNVAAGTNLETQSCTGDNVCIFYSPKNNTGDIITDVLTNNFVIKFSDNAAVYFSTIQTHSAITDPSASSTNDIIQYNSIYAVNTFFNEGESGDANKIVYYYYNVKDTTTYSYGITADGSGYKLTLTIDASGTYVFHIIDIFGNEKVVEDNINVSDVANRDLTIFFLQYTDATADTLKGSSTYGTNKSGEAIFNYHELGADLSVVTNENVRTGLEFYYEVQINGGYGIGASGSADRIKKNPLFYNVDGSGDYSRQLKMYASNGSVLTYYCRLDVATTGTPCISTGYGSNFTQRALTSKTSDGGDNTQTIAAIDSTGLKAVTNGFLYETGIVPVATENLSAERKSNRVDFSVNENGRFYVYIQDALGNYTDAHIDISIIDQLRPVITVNKGNVDDFTNYICSSMYVIGAAQASTNIQGYPTDVITSSGCAAQSVTYNHFAEVDPTSTDEIVVVRNNANKASGAVNTNGFYDTGTTSVNFNYLDAIRIAFLRVSDSIHQYSTTSGGSQTEKSYYEVKSGNTTYTEFELHTKNKAGQSPDNAVLTAATASSGRYNFQNEYIITNNFLQYSSELKPYTDLEMVYFEIKLINAAGNVEDTALCNSLDANCYPIVNSYIDKGISFQMTFTAQDYAGNTALPRTVKVNVIDDTTPGIANIDYSTGELKADPAIPANNMKTECRLEIGSIIQTKVQLLECYKFYDGTSHYNFVDNATTYDNTVTTTNYTSSNYYKNVLHAQLYQSTGFATYSDSIQVYICVLSGNNQCNDTDTNPNNNWLHVDGTLDARFIFDNAGTYEIKFVITDTGLDYAGGTTPKKNTTTVILSYYVNPRVLLVRPIAKEKVYGQAENPIDYCVYATKNTDAFHYNLFNIPSGASYTDTYDFVLKNYESNQGLVYCTNDAIANDTSATSVGLHDVGTGVSATRGILATTNGNVVFEGALSRTYATGKHKYNMELTANPSGQYEYGSIYEDAGYYYITMGDLGVTLTGSGVTAAQIATLKKNYIIRLHPSYLLDGQTPNTSLKSYNELTGDIYKYPSGETGAVNNANEHGETISNVLFKITQAPLTITANGGSKKYGTPDTNYSQSKVGTANNNISAFTTVSSHTAAGVKTESAVTGTGVGSTRGYLNGFTVSGLVQYGSLTEGYKSTISDYAGNEYNNILSGYLRRQSGENVGRYYICNNNASIVGNTIDVSGGCNISPTINTTVTEVTLSGNVYKLSGGSYSSVAGTVQYGMYVKIADNKYYKLTRDNTIVDGGAIVKFKNFHDALLWRYDYDDSDYSLKVLPNANNNLQNYYIIYQSAFYKIEPRTLIVQPGANQGKEYSNPTHNDPIYEIVVYGEDFSVSGANNTDFDDKTKAVAGYTADIGNPSQATTPTKDDYGSGTKNSLSITGDTDLYFGQRRTKTVDINNATYIYEFDPISLDGNNIFGHEGVDYKYIPGDGSNPAKICLVKVAEDCIANGGTIGVNKIEVRDVSGTLKAFVSWSGYLTYQTYSIFTSDGTAGTGKISRTNVYTSAGEQVGWYEYTFTYANLRSMPNINNHCDVDTSNYTYTVGDATTSACANFEVEFKTQAPSRTGEDTAPVFTTRSVGALYLHDGKHGYDSGVYSLAYPADTKKIMFSIFKRDIIISFDAASETYGQVYGYFTGVGKQLYIAPGSGSGDNADVLTRITCYKKDTSGKYEVAGVKYSPISDSDCGTGDYGLSAGDKWGSATLNLQLFLHSNISSTFDTNYAVPAGLYYVYATIGTGNVHPNYNLIYIDYNAIQNAKANNATDASGNPLNPKAGALEITSKTVTLTGTYYQKEFGQAVYATYGSNGESLQVATNNPISGVYSTKLSNDKVMNIFDNHYYHCEIATATTYNGAAVTYGCTIVDNTYTTGVYKYNDLSNIYLYTFADGDIINLTSTGKVDEIATNFAGTPERVRPTGSPTGDNYGLLDDAGFYIIKMDNIIPVVATYEWLGVTNLFTVDNGTIYRYTNYNLPDANKTDGGLYITPAQITITVTDAQMKMYGCAYNTLTTSISSSYTHAAGYSDCVETMGTNYDLGYEYTVTNDKAKALKDNPTLYTYDGFSACKTLSDRKTANGCSDITYTGLSYTVTPQYTTTADGSATAPTDGKPANHSLNRGTLYRMYSGADTSVTYTYSDYFGYAAAAQAGTKYQNQKVGKYAITLGNLDADFNSNSQCGVDSMPLKSGGTSLCKNFIVNFDGNNTATHINVSGTDTFSTTDTTFRLEVANLDFTITTRNVVVTTEYNYKVYGDTEPNEGYRCSDLANMFTYGAGTAFGDGFSYTGRSYCSSGANQFISTGVTRFYAMDNSLAKAPWTAWIEEGLANSANYDGYNDTLFDVLSTTSAINRKGQGDATAAKGDKVGKYEYKFALVLNTTYDAKSGSNYVINYLTYTEGSGGAAGSTSQGTTVPTSSSGYAVVRSATGLAALVSLDRWYSDNNHLCLGESDASTSCAYDGDEVFRFTVSGISNVENANPKNDNQYTTSYEDPATHAVSTYTTNLVPHVYFEIVRREIIVLTKPVEKDYGIEEKYTDFTVELCSEYNESTSTCTPIGKTDAWGVRKSLSKEDYEHFYPSGTFSQAKFKGASTDSKTFRGGLSDGAFGIYFYRTPGETVNSYVIVACPTQVSDTDSEYEACRSYYNSTLTTEEARLSDRPAFYAEESKIDNARNASNYIVTTIASEITINQRRIHIAPDENQGFQYGNYVEGIKIAPITFTEAYKTGAGVTTNQGLVNGGLFTGTTDVYNSQPDGVNNQVALCVVDIAQVITCINDRQNTNTGTIVGYVTTGLHEPVYKGGVDGTLYSADDINGLSIKRVLASTLKHNVYNDDYSADNDTTRFALTRVDAANNDARYNRNVGTYTITAGELSASAANCTSASVNCLNANYDIDGFTTGITYTITPAVITITPNVDQKKTYGQSDVHLSFTIVTTFEAAAPNEDQYYCTSACQSITGTQTVNGFAYGEDDGSATHNYGKAKNSVKGTGSEATRTSDYTTSHGDNNPKYYDKYCLGAPVDCQNYSATHEYVSLKYTTATSRILLGYFYVEEWKQSANAGHKILNGIVVAKNEFGNVNYTYNVALGADTGVTFEIEKLRIDATIVNVTKTYGQSTDAHKCDSGYEAACTSDFALSISTNSSHDNENRLEYNFNVFSLDASDNVLAIDAAASSVNKVGDKVLLTREISGHFYTQTSLAEYKNIHLGLTVVRANNNANTCIATSDIYGCEDVGEYTLVFRKQSVTNNVDNNYDVTFNKAVRGVSADQKGYVIVNSTQSIKYDQRDGETGSDGTEVQYTIYPASGLDGVLSNQKSGAADNDLTAIDIIQTYTGTLKIEKREVTFYVGTYNPDGSVYQRYVIEQNEQVPTFPRLNNYFTTTTTTVKKKEVRYVTWFDSTEYESGGIPRNVRTGDHLVGADAYGVVICKTATPVNASIKNEVYGAGNCTSTVAYADVNRIDSSTGSYMFDTSVIGDYAILRNKASTYIKTGDTNGSATGTNANETRNYAVIDVNGVLVIYEDQTDPVIQIGNGDVVADKHSFVIEANAHTVLTSSCATNTAGAIFHYNCNVAGLKYDENNKQLGQIISYITNNYSGYNSAITSKHNPSSWSETLRTSALKLPTSIPADISTWIYQPVNNIGLTSSNANTTLYSVDRSVNTYDFDSDYIDSNLEAISSIISWFNITSYDYSYFRGTSFDDSVIKRYTPRYYFYIEGSVDGNLAAFDPTYVGDFTIKIYAMDDVGNYSDAPASVTLRIVDTTNPETGTMHLFNAPVVCLTGTTTEATVGNCATNNINDWYVKSGYVHINAFRKYRKIADDNYTEDNTNGTYIRLNGSMVNIYGGSINRYLDNVVQASKPTNILGNYVYVSAKATKAVEVEHMYWSNIKEKYLVVVGGKDNSYIDGEYSDTLSQWETYYSINGGSAWFKYDRHDYDGVTITLADGITTIVTRVLDTGRSFSVNSTGHTYEYYKDIYLKYVDVENGQTFANACSGIANCTLVDANLSQSITQVQNAPVTYDSTNSKYLFKLHSVDVTFTPDPTDGITGTGASTKVKGIVEWDGQSTTVNVTDNVFRFGIMTCTIDPSNGVGASSSWVVNCQSLYALIYKTGDKVTTQAPVYTVTDLRLFADMDAGDTTPTGFYKDRRYIFVDTGKPTFDLVGQEYSVYEYAQKCRPLSPGEEADTLCANNYQEKFLNADDVLNTSNNTSTVSGTAAAAALSTYLTATADEGYSNGIAWYTLYDSDSDGSYDKSYKNTTPSGTMSGLLENSTDVMSGVTALDVTAGSATSFNKHKLDLTVYLSVQTRTATKWYRYIAIYNGTNYIVYRQQYVIDATTGAGSYEVISTFATTPTNTQSLAVTLTTVEAVLEYIVSTASMDYKTAGYEGSGVTDSDPVLLTYSINYNIKDAAGNISEDIANKTVRGVALTKLASTVAAAVVNNTGVALTDLGDNRYQVVVNQGVSLSSLLSGITITNFDLNGNNNVDGFVKYTLYYNGAPVEGKSNLAYTSTTLSEIESYLTAPGTYTLKLTSTREVESQGVVYNVEDKPLEFNFVIEAPRTITYGSGDYSGVTVYILAISMISIFLLGAYYTSNKKKKEF